VAKTDDSSLDDLLALKYSKSITTYWPFKAVTEPSAMPTSTGGPSDGNNSTDDGGMPSYVPPLLGTILGLLVVITVLCAILFWVRRKKQRRRLLASDSGASTINKRKTWSWLMGVNADEKDDYYAPGSENPLDESTIAGTSGYKRANPVEAPEDAVIHELGGKSNNFEN
jgi:hypothetical protein